MLQHSFHTFFEKYMFYNQNYFNTDDQSPMLFEFQNALNFNRRLREYIKIVPNWSYIVLKDIWYFL